MIKVKCILGYFDTKLNRHVDIDEEFEVVDNYDLNLIGECNSIFLLNYNSIKHIII